MRTYGMATSHATVGACVHSAPPGNQPSHAGRGTHAATPAGTHAGSVPAATLAHAHSSASSSADEMSVDTVDQKRSKLTCAGLGCAGLYLTGWSLRAMGESVTTQYQPSAVAHVTSWSRSTTCSTSGRVSVAYCARLPSAAYAHSATTSLGSDAKITCACASGLSV